MKLSRILAYLCCKYRTLLTYKCGQYHDHYMQIPLPLPFNFGTEDPVFQMMIRAMRENPHDAAIICGRIFEHYEPCSSQLKAYVRALVDTGQQLPKALQMAQQPLCGGVI